MKIPYGLSNFKDVITQGYHYIDKTQYIPALENAGKYLIFLRPRRFGKSLFISMLEYYYGQQHAQAFDTLFGKLHIGQYPTPLKNSYPILFMEFSGIETGSFERLYSGFNTSVEVAIYGFLRRYDYDLEHFKTIQAKTAPEEKMKLFFELIDGQKILILIDEYDHFANSILADDQTTFKSLVGKGGLVRSFYETIKSATQRGTVDRLFITGVTPLMLDSLTSGFNISTNLSFDPAFNEAMGFTATEVLHLLYPLATHCQLDLELLLTDIKRWYNGYCFNASSTERLYNANMVLYFVKQFDTINCAYPKRMLDPNIASDYGKLLGLFSMGDREANFAVLDELLNTEQVVAYPTERFDIDKGIGRDDFTSLLAYLGFITLKEELLTSSIYTIPNHAIRELYYQYFKVELERRNQITIPNRAIEQAMIALALNNDMQPLINEIAKTLLLLSNRDAMGMDEKHIKVLLLTLLYQSPAYFIQSEREMNRKYPDILLLERSPYKVKHQHLIELKYSKKTDKDAGWQTKREAGIRQVQDYLQLPDIAVIANLSAWLIITDGEKIEFSHITH